MARKEIDNIKIKEMRKNDILQSALVLLCKYDYEDINTKKIAQYSKCSRTLIYYYYKSNEEILNDLIENYFNSLIDFKKKIEAFEKENMLEILTDFFVEKINTDRYFLYKTQFISVLQGLKDTLNLDICKIELVIKEIKAVLGGFMSPNLLSVYFSIINGLALSKLTKNELANTQNILKLFEEFS